MRVIEGIEKVLERLEPHWDAIHAHFDAENARFKELMAQEHDSIGRVLKCHLIVEHFLERFLLAHYRIDSLERARLSFFQKAQLLPSGGSAAAFVKPGILTLNRIRNHIGHTLGTDIPENGIESINQVLAIARKGVKLDDTIQRIETFTAVACAFLIVPPPNLQEVFMDAFSEVEV